MEESPSSQDQFRVSHDLTYYPTVSSGPTDNHAHAKRLASLPGLPISSSAHPMPWMLLRTLLTHKGVMPTRHSPNREDLLLSVLHSSRAFHAETEIH